MTKKIITSCLISVLITLCSHAKKESWADAFCAALKSQEISDEQEFSGKLFYCISTLESFKYNPGTTWESMRSILNESLEREVEINKLGITDSKIDLCYLEAKGEVMKVLAGVMQNIASINVPGYKAIAPEWSVDPIDANPCGMLIKGYSRTFNQGSLQSSYQDSHLALEGVGFFHVQDSVSGDLYASRAGDFRINAQQKFVLNTSNLELQGLVFDPAAEPSYTVSYQNDELIFTLDTPSAPSAPTQGTLSLDYKAQVGKNIMRSASVPNSITDYEIENAAPRLRAYSFDYTGELKIQLTDGVEFIRGQILLMTFDDPQALEFKNGLFSNLKNAGIQYNQFSTPASGNRARIRQRMLEGSNIDLIDEVIAIRNLKRLLESIDIARLLNAHKESLTK